MDNGVYYGNGNILGYDRYEELLPDKTKLVEFHINPEQAKTVRLIFDMYLDGCGLVKIKDELERRGYKTSQGKEKWFPTVMVRMFRSPYGNSFTMGSMPQNPQTLRPSRLRTLLLCSRLYSFSCWARKLLKLLAAMGFSELSLHHSS